AGIRAPWRARQCGDAGVDVVQRHPCHERGRSGESRCSGRGVPHARPDCRRGGSGGRGSLPLLGRGALHERRGSRRGWRLSGAGAGTA
ncbi:hypothetical protein LTR94_030799, partial [Friedmanniomyces endolithicus]